MINAKLQNIIDTKSAIGNAITNKGGTITANTPFFNYAAQIDGISTGPGAYSNFVAQAQNNSKYTVYNGYDAITNPTPNLSNNFAFNRWLLNNSATGDVILSNVVVAVGGNYNGPNATLNEALMVFVNSTNAYGGPGSAIYSITTNNGFIYAAGTPLGGVNRGVSKFYESNLVLVGNTVNHVGGTINAMTINNGFIYIGGGGGSTNQTIQKFSESNLGFVGNTANYGFGILSVVTNNGFIYASSFLDTSTYRGDIRKYNESTLDYIGNTALYNSTNYSHIYAITINNGFIYGGGQVDQTVQKFGESNLTRVGNTNSYGGTVLALTTNNGFLYVGGFTDGSARLLKYHESNLVFVGNTPSYGGIRSVTTNNGFLYVGGFTNGSTGWGEVRKFYESNLALVGNAANYSGQIRSITTNNGFIYAGGETNATVQKYYESSFNPDQTFYNITTIKEDI